jgi:hypothetical protein
VSVAAETAVRAWVNARPDLTGLGNPLSNGAYIRAQRSPASGIYAVIVRDPSPGRSLTAENEGPSLSRVSAFCYAGTAELAEIAAVALANAWKSLRGNPEPCGSSGVTVYATDNLTGPAAVPTPADSGEPYCFQVSADFILAHQQ